MHVCIHVNDYDRPRETRIPIAPSSIICEEKNCGQSKKPAVVTPVEMLFVSWKILLLVYVCNVLFRARSADVIVSSCLSIEDIVNTR